MLRHLAVAVCLVALAGAGAYVLVVLDRAAEPVGAERDASSTAPSRPAGSATEDRADGTAAAPVVLPQPDSAPPLQPRDVTPPGTRYGPVRRYDPPPHTEASEAPQEEEPESTSFPRVVVEGAGVLRAGDRLIRLKGIAAPEPDATCTDSAGAEWPCGRAAMSALRLLVRNRAVDCAIAEEDGGTLMARCAIGGRDLGAWLVEQGWAEPADAALYEDQFATARQESRGMFAEIREQAPPPVTIPAP